MTAHTGTARRILVVDDEPLVCDSVRRMLVSYGHDVVMATSARAGLDLFEPGRFDLVILDYLMPDMKGDEMAALIKAQSANQPILIITAAFEALQSSGTPLVNVDSVITKPFELEELRDAVDAVLEKRSP